METEGSTAMRRSIIAGVDGSPEAVGAAGVAASLARRLDRRLILAHVGSDSPPLPDGQRSPRATKRLRAIHDGDELLEAVAAEIGEQTAERRVALAGFLPGASRDRLAALCREEDTDLLVVGSRARGPFMRALRATTSMSLARTAPCPVVVIRSGVSDPFAEHRSAPIGPVICGLDGSAESQRARVVAGRLADSLGLQLLPILVDRIGLASDTPERIHVEAGHPGNALAAAASRRNAPLIVVGRRRRATLLGSVARELAAVATAPVVIVPAAARLPDFGAAPAAELRATLSDDEEGRAGALEVPELRQLA